jgi:hypothetical protein
MSRRKDEALRAEYMRGWLDGHAAAGTGRATSATMSTQLAVIHQQVKAIPDHESRIRELESAKAKLIGAAVAISVVLSSFGTWVVTHH